MSDDDDFFEEGDGWEDEDALDDILDDDDGNEAMNNSPLANSNDPTRLPLPPSTDDDDDDPMIEDGWDEPDDDMMETEPVPAVTTPSPPPVATLVPPPGPLEDEDIDVEDGWDEDLDVVIDNESAPEKEDAWGDDDDDLFGDDDNTPITPSINIQPKPATASPAVATSMSSTPVVSKLQVPVTKTPDVKLNISPPVRKETPVVAATGWDDDDDAFDDFDDFDDTEQEEEKELPKQQQQQQQQQQPIQQPATSSSSNKYLQELEDYLIVMTRLQNSITAVLEAEYNTQDKAIELQQYYAQRPALKEYTIDKELPRMEYTVRTIVNDCPNVTSDKATIAAMFKGDQSLVSRCSNQSILADILQVLTGPDLFIRPQYLATAIATKCQFKIDMNQNMVGVQACLDVSLPSPTTGRWKVAELDVVIVFGCPLPNNRENQQPFVQFRVPEIRPVASPQDPDWRAQLHGIAELLSELNPEELPPATPPSLNFRDAFLQQTQNYSTNFVVGMRSALQEIDSVAGISKKMPGFLPNDVLAQAAAAEQEAIEHHMMMQKQQQQQQVPPAIGHGPQQQQPQPPPGQARPTSILGGFVRSLAKSVALPEEDPSLYQEWQQEQQQKPSNEVKSTASSTPPRSGGLGGGAIPKLYNKEQSPDSGPHSLFHKESAQEKTVEIPKLYQKEPTPTKESPPKQPFAAALAPLGAGASPDRSPDIVPSKSPVAVTTQPAASTVASSSAGASIKPPPSEVATKQSFAAALAPLSGGLSQKDIATVQAASTHKKEIEVNDGGWNDDDEVDIDLDEPKVPPEASVPISKEEDDLKGWVYDPKTDIIPTRKRWVNPRPGSRMLRSFVPAV